MGMIKSTISTESCFEIYIYDSYLDYREIINKNSLNRVVFKQTATNVKTNYP